jgi:hypothetical protein
VASPASNASRPLEGTAPSASGASGSSNRPSVDITAVTTRDDFLLELGDALGGQASVRPVDSVNAALEFLQNTKRGQVLVFDSRDIASIREEVDLAHAEAPHAVMLVFATSDAEKQHCGPADSDRQAQDGRDTRGCHYRRRGQEG